MSNQHELKGTTQELADEFQFPDYDPLSRDFRPGNWADLIDVFEEWMTAAGAESNQAYLGRCGKYVQRVLPKDPMVIETVLRIHAGILGWVNHRIPDSKSFLVHATAIASESLRMQKGVLWTEMKEAERRAEIKREIDLFTRNADIFERLGKTVESRIDILRSLNTNAREKMGGRSH